MKRGLLKAALALCAAAVMLFGGSVRSMPEIVDPATLPTRSPSMSAMPPEPSESPEPETSPSPGPSAAPEEESYVISFIGDITPDSVAAYRNTAQGYQSVVTADNLGDVFENTKQYLEDDDFTLANFECVLSDGGTAADKNFVFRAPPEYAGILTEGGVEFVTLGNNHTMDFGQTGLDNTKGVLEEYGVAYAAPDASCIYEADGGITVGLYAAPWTASQAQVVSGVVALANNPDVDIVICLMHWGIEGSYRQNSTQTSTAYAAINAGADIVYGSHPHVLQPIEEYNGGYIVYSLGNYVFGGNTAPRDRDTAIVQFTVKRSADGSVSVEGWEAIPCSLSSTPVTNDFRPEPYEEGSEEYERAMSKLNGTFTGPDLVVDYSEYEDEGEAGTTEQPAPSAAPEDGVTEGEDAVETE